MELTVQNVYGLLLRSKLLSLDDAKAMYARWQAEARDAANNVARFASWMVANKHLTEYQAGLLVRGHADGFFLNDYKILDRLGKGRMAGVYKAHHRLGQVFAVKVLPPSKSKESNLMGRFQREAKLAMRLRHPNVVRAFQVGESGGIHYLVMEYLEGETLEDVLARRKKLAPAEAVRLVYQALQGLQHIHAQGVVHRDLKPSNLMLVAPAPAPGAAAADTTVRSTVKLLDIGLGRTLFEDGEGTQEEGLTGEGVLLGTPDYMAPEQARDARGADIRADIYSLGCVLYHALTGQPPFPDTNIISQMIRHATEPPRPLKEFNPAIPDGLQQILNWMLAKDPAGRYPTPERAAQALQVFLAAGADPLHTPDSDPKMRSYLTWLEVEGKQPPASPAPVAPSAAAGATAPALALPAAPPRPAAAAPAPPAAAPAVAKAAPAAGPRPAHGKRRGKKRRHGGPAAPPPLPVAAPVVNVELVPVPPPPAAPPRPTGRLTRRDFVVFGAGAAAGALAAAAGYLVAVLTRPK